MVGEPRLTEGMFGILLSLFRTFDPLVSDRDFNVVLGSHETTSTSYNTTSIDKFNTTIFYCNLIDIDTK